MAVNRTRGERLRKEAAERMKAIGKVCPFRLSSLGELPKRVWTPNSAGIACLREKCELWESHALGGASRTKIEGCSLRLGTGAALTANKIQQDAALRR